MSVLIIRKGCNMKTLTLFLTAFTLLLTEVEGGCGGCGPSKTHKAENKGLLESVPRNNYVEGNVLISCGMCNFMNGDNDCALAIKALRCFLLKVLELTIMEIRMQEMGTVM